ncbi:hypothetical protein [Cognatitamlana onchidii]|uniref:hypothetical protein n=1 Tax=Cognatitamlana onchidii TaxID=2562860 RepID=UPI0010A68E9C|nr:hypothetical protein [Algibacter onchidii]
MKTIKTLLATVIVFTSVGVSAQNFTKKEFNREINEVELFTSKERDEIQIWFNQEVENMNMSKETLEAYESNLLIYTSRMMRLNDKDQGYTKDDIKMHVDEIVETLNNKMAEILNQEQYRIHEINFKILTNYIKVRLDSGASPVS